MKAGEIWWATLDPVVGHEQAGRRPVLIVSANWWNGTAAPVVAIVPLSTKSKGMPHHIRLEADTSSGLGRQSYLLPEHLRYVDRQRLVSRAGAVTPICLDSVRAMIFMMLGSAE